METLQAIARRKSIREYKPEQISELALDTILGAGCAAPVGMAAYEAIHLTVLQNSDLLKRISQSAAVLMNRPGYDLFYGAPTVIIVSAQAGAFPNIEIANAAIILENICIAATDFNLGSVFVWGTALILQAEPDLMQELKLPTGFAPVASVALGSPAVPDPQEKNLKQKTIAITRI